MHWASIVAMAVLAVTSAGIVFMFEWEPYQAFAAVSITSFTIVVLAIAILLALAKPSDRSALVRSIVETVRDDLRQLKALLFKVER